ncbi:hypothetical protein H5410_031305 [Solanum commersonii]|uniref:Uncharacterized protein n=1 Tax=Solanum commersonii TaxID=4109 RepID=A0A9J5YJI2_SOLCO|nr:hypothetical protein H5410_031305 [Solanum commersonii]
MHPLGPYTNWNLPVLRCLAPSFDIVVLWVIGRSSTASQN